jgi:lipopolysaccharide transport system ATP-binding protein
LKPILEIKKISKKFQIQGTQVPYLSLRDTFSSLFKKSAKKEDFWALKDISFDVMAGDTIGIVGKNGAGKSTLLKILSRITPPSSGSILSRGRIASLLEVGTGFHSELSGRENVYMNGSILGMRRAEINKNFDAIVDFAGIDQFIDTPLKHYSSGMQLRLAFAVAAFLENEILIIDEVLAVGDAEFQKKCIGKMNDVSKNGRTLLFVSHNMSALSSLCAKSIYIQKGQLKSIGETNQIVSEYLSQENANNASVVWKTDERPGDKIAKLNSTRLIDVDFKTIEFLEIHQKVGIEFIYEILEEGFMPLPNVHVRTLLQEYAFSSLQNAEEKLSTKGIHKSIVWIPANILNDQVYSISIGLTSILPFTVHFYTPDILMLNAIEDMTRRKHDYTQKIPGIVRPKLSWETL